MPKFHTKESITKMSIKDFCKSFEEIMTDEHRFLLSKFVKDIDLEQDDDLRKTIAHIILESYKEFNESNDKHYLIRKNLSSLLNNYMKSSTKTFPGENKALKDFIIFILKE